MANIERRKLGPQFDDLDVAGDVADQLMPYSVKELDREIANTRDPALKRVLLQQREENRGIAKMVGSPNMQAHQYGGRTHYFPSDATDEEIVEALEAWEAQQAPQQSASQGDVRAFESQQSAVKPGREAFAREELFNSWMQATGGQLQPGQTQDQAVAEWARKNAPELAPALDAERPDMTSAEAIAGHPLVRAAMGAASPVLGLAQLMANLAEMTGVPGHPGEQVNEYLARLQKLKEEGRLLHGSEGFDFAELAGTALSPAFLWAAKMKVPMGYLYKIAQGAGIGAAAGATAPITDGGHNFAKDKTDQIKFSAVVGGAVPAIATPAKAAAKWANRAIVEPHFPRALGGNQEAIKGRALLEAAGDKVDDIEKALRKEHLGATPTAGQAATEAGSAEFSAFAKSAERAAPSKYNEILQRQNEARRAALRSFGKDEAALDAAVASRTATTGEMYKTAYDVMVKRDPVLRQLWKNPYFRKALPEAWELAQSKGWSKRDLAKGENLTEFLHFVKTGLDEQLAAGPAKGSKALSSTQKAAVQEVKQNLMTWLGQDSKNPAYEAARQEFARQSGPINQMKVGQYLEDKLVPAIADDAGQPIARQSATQFANARRDAAKTLDQSDLGGPRFKKLKQVLKPEQVKIVDDIYNELGRNASFDELAKAGRGAGPNALDLATGAPAPQVFSRSITIFNAIMRRLEGKLNKKLAAEIAVEMAHPVGIADSLAKAKAKAAFNANLADKVQRYGIRHSAAVGAHNPEQAKGAYNAVSDALTDEEE